MKIKTTHVGSLPRPAEMHTKLLKKDPVTQEDLRGYVRDLLSRQLSLGLTFVNNGEVPRPDYVTSTTQRIAGFNGSCTAPVPKDMEDLPEYARRFGARNALITLNPKAPVKLPACSDPLSYTGEASLREEVEMMLSVFHQLRPEGRASDAELFFTSPSPGTIALFLENAYYPSYESYLEEIGSVMQQEYEIIAGYGIHLQVDCPDLAMGRHTRFKHLDEDAFLSVLDTNIGVLNEALANIPTDRCRAHVCWGNYPGTHHRDIDLGRIFHRIVRLRPKSISIESSNHRHGHEWRVFERHVFPADKILLPGVIDTTSNHVEHPRLVAERILAFSRLLGPERVIASTDCGFASTASATGVSGEVAWLKLNSLVEGARIAESELS